LCLRVATPFGTKYAGAGFPSATLIAGRRPSVVSMWQRSNTHLMGSYVAACSFLNFWFGLRSDFRCVLRRLGDMCVVGAGRPACSKVVLMYSSTFAESLSAASFDPLKNSSRSKTSMKSRSRDSEWQGARFLREHRQPANF
jgi:hypothetical protein